MKNQPSVRIKTGIGAPLSPYETKVTLVDGDRDIELPFVTSIRIDINLSDPVTAEIGLLPEALDIEAVAKFVVPDTTLIDKAIKELRETVCPTTIEKDRVILFLERIKQGKDD